MAANLYHEVIQVEVRDQSQAALTTVQKNVEKTEGFLNRISKAPFTVVVKLVDMLTRPLTAMLNTAASLARRALSIPVTLADRVTQPFRNLMGGLREQANQMVLGIGQGIGQAMLGLVGQGFGAVKGSIIGMNATLETSTLQFETLMGSADEAQKHVADLFDFAKKTPFETQPVIDASRMLRTFGGNALDTMDNLTLFGNASAATSADIKEVSFWFGRAYAAMQAGQPFGEATMRLQELAILSPQAAAKLEQLQKQGAKADVLWKAMTGDLGRFNGAMDKQAETWDGLTSTLSDAISLTSAKVFEPLFKVAKSAVGQLNDALSGDAFTAWADKAGKALSGFVVKAGGWIKDFADGIGAINEAFTGDPGAIGVIYDLIRKTFGDTVANQIQPFLQKLMDFIPTLKDVGTWLGFAFKDLTKGDIKNVLIDIGIAFQKLTGIDISGLVGWLIKMGEVIGTDFQNALDNLKRLFTDLAPTFDRLGSAFEKLGPLIAPAASDLTNMTTAAGDYKVVDALATAINSLSGAIEVTVGWLISAADWFGKNKALQAGLVFVTAWLTTLIIAQNIARAIQTAQLIAQAAPFALWIAQMYAAAAAQAILNAVMMLNPFVLVATLVIALAAALVFLWNTNEDFRNAVTGIWSAIQQAVVPVLEFLGEKIEWLWHNVVEPAIPSMLGLWEDFKNNTVLTLALLPVRLLEIGAEMINGLIKGMTGVDVIGWIKENIVDKIPDFIKDKLGIHSPSSVFADMGNNMMQGLVNGLTARLPDIMSFMSNLSNVFGGTDVGGWIDAAIRATGVPASWAGPLSQIIQSESGGNPMAANLTDVNAQNGDTSVGLMQLTGSNRARYTPAGLNPLDPIAQIIAGIRYIQDRYGDISAVPGVASLAGGGAYVPYDSGGVLPPGLTMAANNTGSNEFVMTPGQMAALGGSGVVFAPVFNIDAAGAAPGVGEEISGAIEEQSARLFSLLGGQLRVAFGNLASEGGAT